MEYQKASWLSKPCTHASACLWLSDYTEWIPQVTFSIAFLRPYFIPLCFSCAHRCTQHRFPSLKNERGSLISSSLAFVVCECWNTFFFGSLVSHEPSLTERTCTEALTLAAAAGVQYLLPGWSRDRDLDRERAWSRDRLWLTLWSAASTGHSGQKASRIRYRRRQRSAPTVGYEEAPILSILTKSVLQFSK